MLKGRACCAAGVRELLRRDSALVCSLAERASLVSQLQDLQQSTQRSSGCGDWAGQFSEEANLETKPKASPFFLKNPNYGRKSSILRRSTIPRCLFRASLSLSPVSPRREFISLAAKLGPYVSLSPHRLELICS